MIPTQRLFSETLCFQCGSSLIPFGPQGQNLSPSPAPQHLGFSQNNPTALILAWESNGDVWTLSHNHGRFPLQTQHFTGPRINNHTLGFPDLQPFCPLVS